MRIYDDENEKALKTILIMLTPEEVKELIDSLECLTTKNDHVHVNDESYRWEITVGLYTPQNTHTFRPEVVRLIQEDE